MENRAPRSPRACRLAAPASSSPPWPSPWGVTAHDRGVVGLGVIGNVSNSATVCPVLRALPHAFHGPSPVPPSTLRKRFRCRSLAQMRKLRVGAVRESVRSRPGGEGHRARLPVRGACAWASTGQLRQATDRPARAARCRGACPAPSIPEGLQRSSRSIAPYEPAAKSVSPDRWPAGEQQSAELQEVPGLECVEFQQNPKSVIWRCGENTEKGNREMGL